MHESPLRDVPVTMFDKIQLSTSHPLNVDLMYGCGGRDTNVENFVRDIVRFGTVDAYPRLFNLTSSLEGAYTDDVRNFNTIYYRQASNRKRNLTVLPCDDGSFRLNYSSLASLSGSDTTLFKSYRNAVDYSQIQLTGIVEPYPATSPAPVGQTRQDPGGQRQDKDNGAYYQVQYEDQEVYLIFGSLIDVSVMHYGHRIKGSSFEVVDSSVTGSCDRVKITYRDDGRNGLYRTDCLTTHATWNTQGLMFTNEGVGIVLSPTVPFFAKDGWSMGFDTDASQHVLTMDVAVGENTANISQNPTYRSFPPTTGSDDVGSSFVYIDTVNVHDENLNVVARATLAQPILKRPEDDLMIRLKLDF